MKNYDPETKEYYLDNSDLLLVNRALNTIKEYCEKYPTCEGCSYNNDKVLGKSGGCYFRHHSPREWKTDN